MVRRISKSEIAGVLEQWRVGSLIKFVTQRVYAEQLIQGIPYLQAIDEFRSKEAGDGRSDAYEGLLTSFMSVGSSRAIYCMTALEDSNYQFFLQSKDGRRIRDEFSNRGAAVLIKDPVEFLLRFQEAEPKVSILDWFLMTETYLSPRWRYPTLSRQPVKLLSTRIVHMNINMSFESSLATTAISTLNRRTGMV